MFRLSLEGESSRVEDRVGYSQPFFFGWVYMNFLIVTRSNLGPQAYFSHSFSYWKGNVCTIIRTAYKRV